MPEMMEKVRAARACRDSRGLDYRIEVDGGLNARTGVLALEAGAPVGMVNLTTRTRLNFARSAPPFLYRPLDIAGPVGLMFASLFAAVFFVAVFLAALFLAFGLAA